MSDILAGILIKWVKEGFIDDPTVDAVLQLLKEGKIRNGTAIIALQWLMLQLSS